MKKMIIASQICMFPLFLLGIANPTVVLMMHKEQFNIWNFGISITILLLCVIQVLATIRMFSDYIPNIDKLEKEIEEYKQEKNRLSILIQKYNQLILEQQNK